MFNKLRQLYAERILQAFQQAPWRRQVQNFATWSVALLVLAVVGGLYLTVAARSGTAGRDLQNLAERKTELIQTNDELRAQLAVLRSVTRLEARARAMGFQPARPEEIEYVAVKNYVPVATPLAAKPVATAVVWPSFGEWLLDALGIMQTGG